MKKRGAQVFAILALLGIIISVVGTGLLILTTPAQPQQQEAFTQEELQKILQNSQVEVEAETLSGVTIESTDIEVNTDTSDEIKVELDTIEVETGETQ